MSLEDIGLAAWLNLQVAQIDKAFDIVNYIYEKYKDKESKEEIISRIKDSLKAVRFNNNRGYYYIYTIGRNKCFTSYKS